MVEKLEVQILGEGDLPEELNKSTKALKEFDKQLEATDKTNQSIVGSFTELNSMITLGKQAMQVAGEVYGETVGKAQDYNRSILVLSENLGITTEETSRLVQAADDLGVSQDTVKRALEMLSKNGITPTITNLGALSDRLLAIEDTDARNAEAAKLLGRNWAEAGQVIFAGSEKINRLTAAQADGLVVTEEESKKSEELRQKIDTLNDSKEALAITVGNELVPAMTDLLDVINGTADAVLFEGKAMNSAGVAMGGNVENLRKYYKAQADANLQVEYWLDHQDELVDGHDLLAQASNDSAEGINATKDALDKEKDAILGGALKAIDDMNISLADQIWLRDKLSLAAGEITEKQKEENKVMFLAKEALESGQISREQYYDWVLKLSEGLLSAADFAQLVYGAMLKIPSTKDVHINIWTTEYYTSGGEFGAGGGKNVSDTVRPVKPKARPGGTYIWNGREWVFKPYGGNYASGGSFMVPGSGNYDQPFLLGLTPGEMVTVTPQNVVNNFNLSVSTVQSAGRVVEDFALMRALAGV